VEKTGRATTKVHPKEEGTKLKGATSISDNITTSIEKKDPRREKKKNASHKS